MPLLSSLLIVASAAAPPAPGFQLLKPESFKSLILNVSNPHYWNGSELIGIDPEAHYEWATANTPFFECSDTDITEAYYFRWYSYHNHIHYQTPSQPFSVVTEFYPKVSWASKYNTIPCAAGHHIHEGRWLRDENVMSEYLRFWFFGGGSPEV